MSKRTWQYWVRRDLCGGTQFLLSSSSSSSFVIVVTDPLLLLMGEDFPEIPPGSNFHPKDEYGDRKRVLVQREIDDLKRQDERLKARLRIDWQW